MDHAPLGANPHQARGERTPRSAAQGLRVLLAEAHASQLFSGASVEIGDSRAARLTIHVGGRTSTPDATPIGDDSLFDLASLTKVIATTAVVQRLVEREKVTLGDPVGRWISGWRGGGRERATIADLLSHSSGLPAHASLYESAPPPPPFTELDAFVEQICHMPLAYVPQTASIYSDLGFILLADIVERATGTSFRSSVESLIDDVDRCHLLFTPRADERRRCVMTGFDPWRGRVLEGEVHDNNAWALGGVAGHAGLFGTLPAVGRVARRVLQGLRALDRDAPPNCSRLFATPSKVAGSSRALGWDTMRPTSSCGPRLSLSSIGHTGFTGTSLWIDWEQDAYSVLLTNRVATPCPPAALLPLRQAVHSASIAVISSAR